MTDLKYKLVLTVENALSFVPNRGRIIYVSFTGLFGSNVEREPL